MRISADRDVCIGSGNCVLLADEVFDQDDEATVVLLLDTPSTAQESRVRDAVAQCPSHALSLTED
jgi:ferredoxin